MLPQRQERILPCIRPLAFFSFPFLPNLMKGQNNNYFNIYNAILLLGMTALTLIVYQSEIALQKSVYDFLENHRLGRLAATVYNCSYHV